MTRGVYHYRQSIGICGRDAANSGNKRCRLLHRANSHRVRLTSDATATYINVVTARRQVGACITSQSGVKRASCVIQETGTPARCVMGAGCVLTERLETMSGVRAANVVSSAEVPLAVFWSPVVLLKSALNPMAVLKRPVPLLVSAFAPIAVLSLALFC